MQKIVQVFMIAIFIGFGSQSIAQEISEEKQIDEKGTVTVGEKFHFENIFSTYEMEDKYQNLRPGDTLGASFKAEVISVCKKKGCWMKVALANGAEVMVKFKDYAFFVPRDIETSTVIMKGKAYVEEMSVEDQRHYGEDEGLSREETAAIQKPKKTLFFMADGVNIKK